MKLTDEMVQAKIKELVEAKKTDEEIQKEMDAFVKNENWKIEAADVNVGELKGVVEDLLSQAKDNAGKYPEISSGQISVLLNAVMEAYNIEGVKAYDTPLYLRDLNNESQDERRNEIQTERLDLVEALEVGDDIQVGTLWASDNYKKVE